MARLNAAARESLIHEPSPEPPPSSSQASTDADPATQQLLGEVRASASKLQNTRRTAAPMTSDPLPSSAKRGADLLNAARKNFRHSSPPREPPKTDNRKLSKVSKGRSFTEPRQPRKRFSMADYEVPEGSPEKGHFTLPERVNHKPLKILKKKKKAAQRAGHSDADVSSSDPPVSSQHETHNVNEQPSAEQDSSELSTPPQMSSDSNRTDDGDEQSASESDLDATVEEPQRSKQQDDNESPSRASAKRKSAEALDSQGRARKSRRLQKHTSPDQEAEEVAQPIKKKRGQPKKTTINSSPEVQIPVRKSNKVPPSASEPRRRPQEPVAASIEEADPTQSMNDRRNQSKANRPTETAATKSKKVTKSTNASKVATSSEQEPQADAEEDDDEDDSDSEAPVAKHPPGTIEHVFEFLDLDDREGGCQTKLGITINRVCAKTSQHLQGDDLAIEEVADNIDDVREVLKQVERLDNDGEMDLAALKGDMFGYVFRSLILVLESLYECIRDMDENFMHSLAAMRIITPLMRDILGLKQTIAGWKVKTTQRYQGDHIIEDVDSHLIVPLREVYTIYRNRVSQLKNKDLLRQRAARIAREAEEQAEVFARQQEEEASRKQRWRRWQDLHITRLKCEPDPPRRHNLVITKLEELEERDANGFEIERLQVFKHRSNPPRSWASQRAQNVPWSDEETLALIRGLETFAGPDVFHNIFGAYCCEGGLLRDFSVAEIVAKAMWVKTSMQRLHQEQDEEIPDWIKEMPSLP